VTQKMKNNVTHIDRFAFIFLFLGKSEVLQTCRRGNGHGARRCDVTANTLGGFLFGFDEKVQVGFGGGRGSSR